MASVKLRKKLLTTGRQTLILDYYPPIINHKTGKAQRFVTMKLYLYTKPESELQRIHNKETLIAYFSKSDPCVSVQTDPLTWLPSAVATAPLSLIKDN